LFGEGSIEKKEKEKEKDKDDKKKDKDDKKKEKKRVQTMISEPTQVKQLVHVSSEMEWSGEDPANIFELERKVGEGAFGSVYRAIHKSTGFVVAVKTLPAGEKPQDIEKEISVLKSCRDISIVSYFGSCVKEPLLWILMEFCGCGSVLDLLKKLNKEEKNLHEDQIAAIVTFVLKGLVYLHSRGIIHRDLKPANILLNAAGEAKLADFGVSAKLTQEQQAQTTIGTPLYMSPEVIEGFPYDAKADIWSLGITTIEISQGRLPFADANVMRAIGLIVNGPPPTVNEPSKFSPELNSFIATCLEKDPLKRKKAAEMLTHPFLLSRMNQDHRKVIKEVLERYFQDLDKMDSSAKIAMANENYRKSIEVPKSQIPSGKNVQNSSSGGSGSSTPRNDSGELNPYRGDLHSSSDSSSPDHSPQSTMLPYSNQNQLLQASTPQKQPQSQSQLQQSAPPPQQQQHQKQPLSPSISQTSQTPQAVKSRVQHLSQAPQQLNDPTQLKRELEAQKQEISSLKQKLAQVTSEKEKLAKELQDLKAQLSKKGLK